MANIQDFVLQEHRVCDGCGAERPLSGIAHIERGYVQAFLCLKCADSKELDRLRDLTKTKKRMRRANRT